MLERLLIAAEQAAVTVLGGLANEVTRRKLGFVPPKTNHFALDVTIVPVKSEGHPLGGAAVDVAVTISVFGRGPDGSAVFDRVRFLSDLALERLVSDPRTAALFGHVAGTAFAREETIGSGAAVLEEQQEITVTILSIAGTGQALGIVEAADGDFGAGHARSVLGAPSVHAAGLDTVHLAPATLTAMFAGLAGGATERVELRDEIDTAIASQVLTPTAGTHDFVDVAAGDYTLAIVRVADDQVLATSGTVRVRAQP